MPANLAETAAYNLTPLASLLLLGALLATGPALWVWWRNRHGPVQHRRQALRVFTLFLTFDLVIFGAFTRLTDSGLGCPDWPGCYGSTSPWGAGGHIAAAQEVLPDGPVTHAKAWIEMLHRYLATVVGALIVWLTALAWLDWRRQRGLTNPAGLASAESPWLASFTLFWVCLQGAFGALTVTMKLFPAIVTLHLLGALVLLVLLCVPIARTATPRTTMVILSRGQLGLLVLSSGLLVLQVALGGWVSSNYAVLACSDFPTCQGSWWPLMDFRQGFEVWRGLGLTATGEVIGFAALTAIHYTHRLLAYLVLAFLIWLAWQLNRSSQWRQLSRVLAALAGLQLATGLSNVVLGWPLLAALLHTGGAAALVLTLTWVAARVDWRVSLGRKVVSEPFQPGVSV
ncbi:MAG: COX15/CtaA family protein [Rhodoferax sp.]|jgi:cytochrome c oxidase assembly protein subunit 15|uniref:COX15/CtaA family protein n=1 Tax=Rhodoferax sp. TaxID=50421 RepID=UPI001B604F89|nr:COX15/CtaA family protein [Rhodoferax sp.]MBP9147880.1 COX15/CtaA family protein [Rhodoferax sp.]MBP9736694.1 COX15/CtaA family protein [Rhodoferax sp.]